MNREKFEKLIASVEKLVEKNGFFSTKNKIKAAIKALFIRFKQDPFDIFFWPFYFLHLFLIAIKIWLKFKIYSPIDKIRNFLPIVLK